MLLALALAGVALLGGRDTTEWSRADPAGLPNIVLIQTDDQTLASLNRKTMPRTMRLLADRGTTFNNHAVASPLCCPSRASLLTGQYPHNHRVLANSPGYQALDGKRNTLPAWLQRAGYLTAHVGKFLNRYDQYLTRSAAAAPGWDEWVTMLPPYGYFDYDLGVNGKRVSYGNTRSDYLTTVLNREARRVVAEQLPRKRPLFLALDQFAPHGQTTEKAGGCGLSAVPLPGDFRRFARAQLPSPPSFDETDMSDKPSFRRILSRLPEGRIASMRENYRCRLGTLRAVDRGVGRIYHAVKSAGEIDRTVFIFTSDNGFLQGEHRIPAQKAQPYEEAVRVPLVIKVPRGFRRGTERVNEIDEATSNIDLAPTILQLARGEPCRSKTTCRVMDGRSLLGLLTRRSLAWPEDRAVLLEFTSGHQRNNVEESCNFSALRTVEYSFVEYRSIPNPRTGRCQTTEQYELYDLGSDPYQLDNLATETESAAAAIDGQQRSLALELADLGRCAGIAGRDDHVDDRPYCE